MRRLVHYKSLFGQLEAATDRSIVQDGADGGFNMSSVENLRAGHIIATCLVMLLVSSFAHAGIIHVDSGATGANDGTSWLDAYNYLSEALAGAAAGDEIRVAQGVYRPNEGLVTIPEFDWRTTTFELTDGLTLRGGYAGGGETDPNARDARLYQTILSGDLHADDVEVANAFDLAAEPTRADNSYHVVTIAGPAVLDGLVITGGHASAELAGTQNVPSSTRGGGLWATGDGITIRDCALRGNFAAWAGGGLYANDAELALEGCTFYRNAAWSISHSEAIGWGGGIVISGGSAVLVDCVLSENMATFGGAIDSSQPRYVEAVNCLMTANTALAGGVFFSAGGSLKVLNCTAAGNSAASGCFLVDGTPPPSRGQLAPWIDVDSCILANCGSDISNNWATITIKYTNIVTGTSAVRDFNRDVIWGPGNIEADPLFAAPGYWADIQDSNLIVEPNDTNAIWIDGDYHLQSKAGRYDPNTGAWVQDEASSPCIDAGDPARPFDAEPAPNGIRANMGAYGGTGQASKSEHSWWFATTDGPLAAEGLGVILPHEHIFTDLRGPTTPGYGQADAADVVRVMAPYLAEAHSKGVGLMLECSSIGVGRNAPVLAQVSEASGLPVVVPTGVYGRANFAPPEHRSMTEDELAALFVKEISEGIEDTGIKAGFIKIATDSGAMTPLMERILRAAGRAAQETGAAIASHTPTGSNAIRQVDILRSISPAIRFIWVHAQNESNRSIHRQVAEQGGYIEFDNLGWNPGQDSAHIAAIKDLLDAGCADKILLSHDAGWYRPGEPSGGSQKPYTYLTDTFVPKLKNAGLDDATIRMITETNPIRAFGFKSGE
jgi:phosphotriesterase-related protein